jgi:chromosome partitioning protein
MIQKHLNPRLHLSTILLTMYDGRTRLAQQVADEVRAHFPREVLHTVIPRSVRVSEAPSFGQTVIAYDGNSAGAIAYREAAVEIAQRSRSQDERSPSAAGDTNNSTSHPHHGDEHGEEGAS